MKSVKKKFIFYINFVYLSVMQYNKQTANYK